MGRFHRYSWTNTLLIQQQYPSATRVAGYHTWNDLGRHVKRGEKGIMICAPLLTKVKDQPSPTRGTSPRDVDSVRVTGFRAAYVFDIEQTDGRPLPAFAETRGDPETFMDKLKGFVSEQGIRFSYDPSIAPADGLSSGGEIRLRPGQSPAEEFSVLAHELAHEMLHHGPDRSKLSKVVQETQAEAVAFVVSRGIGLETGTAARDYIALYNGDVKTLTESLTAIQQASSKILNALLPREPEQPERSGDRETVANNDSERADREGVTPARPASGPEPTDGLSLER